MVTVLLLLAAPPLPTTFELIEAYLLKLEMVFFFLILISNLVYDRLSLISLLGSV
jgi:hypothetical protein